MITSKHNPKIKRLKALHQKRNREKEGVFLVEGETAIKLAPKNCIREVYFSSKRQKPEEFPDAIEVKEEVFSSLVYGSDILFVCDVIAVDLSTFQYHEKIVVVESLEKPGNLGAILRTCDAAGINGIIVCNEIADIFHPNVIRASQGAIFSVPIVKASSQKAYEFLQATSHRLLITTPIAKKSYRDFIFTSKWAVVVGGEHAGVSDIWKQNPSDLYCIPMKGKVNSLNVSVSLAIVVYEAFSRCNFI